MAEAMPLLASEGRGTHRLLSLLRRRGPTAPRELHGLTPCGALHTPEGLTGQFGGGAGPSFQAKAAAGDSRRRRPLRACTARVPKKPATDAAAIPSHGAARYATAPAAAPTPQAAST